MESFDHINKQLALINSATQRMLCCEFEILSYQNGKLLIGGGLSLSYPHSICIEFQDVFYVSMVHEWRVDTTKPFIYLEVDELAYELNSMYQIEKGHVLFKIIPEYVGEKGSFYVSAKSLRLITK